MEKGAKRKALDVFSNIILVILTAMALILVFFLLQSKVSGGVPSLGSYQLYIVMSGSMSPAVDTGSLVAVKAVEAEAIEPQDIITFRGEVDEHNITTHRVVAKENQYGIQFTTRGDANDVEDPMPVKDSQIMGKVVLSVPYAGYAFHFARTREGVMALVGLVAAVITLELVKTLREEKYKSKDKSTDHEEVVTSEKG